MRRFEIGVKFNESYNELLYVNIDDKTYTKEMLNEDVVTLLTALSYVDRGDYHKLETYDNLAQYILGYETVVIALNKIHELGYDLIPYHHLRKMIKDMYKIKYKGLMR